MNEDDTFATVAALLRIASDPKACAKRFAELKAERDELSAVVEQNVKVLEEAKQENIAAAASRQAAENIMLDAERWNKQLDVKEKALAEREGNLIASKAAHDMAVSNLKYREAKVGERETTADHREHDLVSRERMAESKFKQAQELLASYDQAKHEAALKLAG